MADHPKGNSFDRDALIISVIAFGFGAMFAWALIDPPFIQQASAAAANTKPSEWPAWVQAVGSIAAILIAVAVPAAQHRVASEAKERETADRARGLGLFLLPHLRSLADSNSDIWSFEHPDDHVIDHGANACFLGYRTQKALELPAEITSQIGRLHELGKAAEGIQRAIYNIERARQLLTTIQLGTKQEYGNSYTIEHKTLIFDKEFFFDLMWDALRGISSTQNEIELFFKRDKRTIKFAKK